MNSVESNIKWLAHGSARIESLYRQGAVSQDLYEAYRELWHALRGTHPGVGEPVEGVRVLLVEYLARVPLFHYFPLDTHPEGVRYYVAALNESAVAALERETGDTVPVRVGSRADDRRAVATQFHNDGLPALLVWSEFIPGVRALAQGESSYTAMGESV